MHHAHSPSFSTHLTSLQKRKAQNRAAQRAFRERKEKHLKDLETKVDELQKASDSANQENGLLRAQVDRMQVELREYRKRLSWVTHGNGASAMNAYPGSYSRSLSGLNNNDFLFDFPKFGDLPGSNIFNGGQLPKANQNRPRESLPAWHESHVPGILKRDSLSNQAVNHQTRAALASRNMAPMHASSAPNGSPNDTAENRRPGASNPTNANRTAHAKPATAQNNSNSESPSSSTDSHQSQLASSSGTSPDSSPNFQDKDGHRQTCGSINGEESFCQQLGLACGNIKNPIPAVRSGSESATNTPAQAESGDKSLEPDFGLDFLSQQNGGQFDPVLFGDWREPQDAILSQDFGSYFNDAFPLPDLGSPSHNFTELASQPASKKAPDGVDSKLDEEVVPGEDKSQMLTCTKIWYVHLLIFTTHKVLISPRDRLQSMDKFRNGEIDVDNLCSELRTKARCSEGGVVVNQRDVDDIMYRTK